MCAVSAVGDYYTTVWPTLPQVNEINRAEFDLLKKEVERMKEILLVAKKYDEETSQPHCRMDEKVEILKRMAALFNIDLSEVFK